jgi:hypothetical protein
MVSLWGVESMAQASQGEGQGPVRGIGVDQVNPFEGYF